MDRPLKVTKKAKAQLESNTEGVEVNAEVVSTQKGTAPQT